MLNWQIETLDLALKFTWKISRNASDMKTNLLVTVGNERVQGRGEAAPNIRYGETPALLLEQFANLQKNGLSNVETVEELQFLTQREAVMPALRFALESALVHYLCRKTNKSVPEFLGVPAVASTPTAFTFPIMDPGKIAAFAQEHQLKRFQYLKVKVNEESGLDMMGQVFKATAQPLIVDANEAWQDPDALIRFMEGLKKYPILMIEQPMPAALDEEYLYLKPYSPYDLFADESVTDHADWDLLKRQFHGVNMKLMKAGGYLIGLEILQKTRSLGLKTMIGCMMETSMGIWSGIQLAHGVDYLDLDGMLVVKDEPFGYVQEKDGILTPIKQP